MVMTSKQAHRALKNNYVPSDCDCEECRKMCKHPCWPTPKEALALIEAGYSNRMMVEEWLTYGDPIQLLCPAGIGFEGNRNPPFWPDYNGCVFYSEEKGCELHDLGLKPSEARLCTAHDDNDGHELHETMAMTWNSPNAQELVKKWSPARNYVNNFILKEA